MLATLVRLALTLVTCVLNALTLEMAPDRLTDKRPTSETRLVWFALTTATAALTTLSAEILFAVSTLTASTTSADVTEPPPPVPLLADTRFAKLVRLLEIAETRSFTDVTLAETVATAAETTFTADTRFAVSTLTASTTSADVTLPLPPVPLFADTRLASDVRLLEMADTRSLTEVTLALTTATAAETTSTFVDRAEAFREIRATSEITALCAPEMPETRSFTEVTAAETTATADAAALAILATDVRLADTATTAALTVFACVSAVVASADTVDTRDESAETCVDSADSPSDSRPTSEARLVTFALVTAWAADTIDVALDTTSTATLTTESACDTTFTATETADTAVLRASSFVTRAAVSEDRAFETTDTACSRSFRSLAVMAPAIWSPTTTVRALEPSCARVIVSTSPTMFVTVTISALLLIGKVAVAQMTAFRPMTKFAPSPAATVTEVPDVAGDGATATVEYPKFFRTAISAYPRSTTVRSPRP
jgi:hypothetical protein